MEAELRALGPSIAAALVTVLGSTLRLRVAGDDQLAPFWGERRPLIYALWHGRILLAPWLNARLRRAGGARAVAVLASRSRDGELLAAFARRFGLDVVRGSSSRGGAAALRGLVAAVAAGRDVAVAPDGPRGPRGRVQPGVVALAALSGAPIVPMAVACRPARRLGSWDELLVPWPFARCQVVFGTPRHLARGGDREQARADLERALVEVTARADQAVRA